MVNTAEARQYLKTVMSLYDASRLPDRGLPHGIHLVYADKKASDADLTTEIPNMLLVHLDVLRQVTSL
jgi:hypothetical protein